MSASVNSPISRLSLRHFSESQLRARLAELALAADEQGSKTDLADGGLPLVEIFDVEGQDTALTAIEAPIRLHVLGPLGDYAFAYNLAADARIDGDVGNGVCEGMRGGSVRVRGNGGCGGGVAMRAGTLAIYGNAGDRLAACMIAGEVFARGNVGADVGVGARSGTIVIGGDAGPRLGEPHSELTIFLRGKAESLAPGMAEAPLRKRDELRVGILLINASIRGDAKDFRRIVPLRILEEERKRVHSEVNPSWR